MLTDQQKMQVSTYTPLLTCISRPIRLLPRSLVRLVLAESHGIIVARPVAIRPLARDVVIFEAC